MGFKHLALLLLAAGFMAGPALADRYVVQASDLPALYSGDAAEYLLNIEPQSGMVPFTASLLGTFTVPAAPAAPGMAAAPGAATTCSTAATEATPRLQGEPCDMTDACGPMPASYTSDTGFTGVMSSIYTAISVPAEIQQIYNWYLKEPGALTVQERVGNGVVRFVMAIDRAPTGDTSSRPDLLKPQSTAGTVRSSNGVGVRGTPWGGPGGAAIANGTALNLVPPADGPWYQVRGGGWVCGLWLNLQ